MSMNRIRTLTAAALLAYAVPASAVTLFADYSQLSASGSVYQSAGGQLSETAAPGFVDVTGLFKTDVSAAFAYLDNAILVPFNHTVTFKLFDLQSTGADGDSLVTGEDANGRPISSTIRIDTSAASHFFLDPTPLDNSEYAMTFSNATLGGGSVNVERFGTAVTGGPADGRTDLLTLALHETIHSIGITDNIQRFVDAVGAGAAPGSPDRLMTIPTSLTGLPTDFTIPFLGASAHIDTFADGGTFRHAVVSEPGFGEGDRALITGAEVYALCVVEGCSANQFNTDPNPNAAIPEPGTLLLLSSVGLALIGTRRRAGRWVPVASS